jgi:DNA-binding transcriptional ArsR family regulator
MLTTFEVLAQPIRRSILDVLRDGEHLVGDVADVLGLTQPLTSKHLRVLRDAGMVNVRVDGPRRWYGLRVEPLAELDDWLAPYRWMWEARLDHLGAHLDAMPDDQGETDDQ